MISDSNTLDLSIKIKKNTPYPLKENKKPLAYINNSVNKQNL